MCFQRLVIIDVRVTLLIQGCKKGLEVESDSVDINFMSSMRPGTPAKQLLWFKLIKRLSLIIGSKSAFWLLVGWQCIWPFFALPPFLPRLVLKVAACLCLWYACIYHLCKNAYFDNPFTRRRTFFWAIIAVLIVAVTVTAWLHAHYTSYPLYSKSSNTSSDLGDFWLIFVSMHLETRLSFHAEKSVLKSDDGLRGVVCYTEWILAKSLSPSCTRRIISNGNEWHFGINPECERESFWRIAHPETQKQPENNHPGKRKGEECDATNHCRWSFYTDYAGDGLECGRGSTKSKAHSHCVSHLMSNFANLVNTADFSCFIISWL